MVDAMWNVVENVGRFLLIGIFVLTICIITNHHDDDDPMI